MKPTPPDQTDGPFDDPRTLQERYRSIMEALQSTPATDIGHTLPNLAETIRQKSKEPEDTIRFTIGVSFTESLKPFDYFLYRITANGTRTKMDELKEAASDRHLYLRFSYPPDPEFTVQTLRGAMLTAVDRQLQAIQDYAETESKNVTGIWNQLAGILD